LPKSRPPLSMNVPPDILIVPPVTFSLAFMSNVAEGPTSSV
jgi:hypothetical protein